MSRTCRGRGLVVVLATGTAISLTALTGGIAPAFADPATGPSTTPVSPPNPATQAPKPIEVLDMPSAPTSEAPSVTVVPSATAASEPPTETKPPPVTSTVATEPVTTAESPEPPSAAPQTTPSASVMTTPNPLPRNISAPVTAEAGPTATVAESAPPPTPPSEATGSVATTSDTPTSISGSPVRTSGVLPSASPPVSQAGQVFEVHQAEQLQAPREDVELARASAPVELRPDPAPKADVDGLRNAIGLRNANADWNDPTAPRRDRDPHEWDKSVRQWDRDWVQYDDWYRPILCNPYRQPVKIV